MTNRPSHWEAGFSDSGVGAILLCGHLPAAGHSQPTPLYALTAVYGSETVIFPAIRFHPDPVFWFGTGAADPWW